MTALRSAELASTGRSAPISCADNQSKVRTRRAWLSLRLAGVVAVILVVAPLAVEAQAVRIPRIGILSPTTADNPLMKAFEQSLAQQGYVTNKTVRFETRYTDGRGVGFSISPRSSPTPRSTSSRFGRAPGP